MTPTEIFAELQKIIRAVFKREDLTLTLQTTAKDVPGWDSFMTVEIIIAAEKRFGTRIQTRDLDRLNNVGDLVTIIADKLRISQLDRLA